MFSGSPPQTSVLAASVITPGFAVAGVVLASIPVIIHLLNRRRFRTVKWAAMDFLLSALKKNRRRVKFEQWLLLATRCAVLALLGLALARPMACDQSGLAAGATRSGLHVLVIDNSYSMAYLANRPGAATHLEHAKNVAKRIVEQLSSGGESVAVITTGKPSAVLLQPTYDLQAAAQAIDRIEQSFSATDVTGALGLAWELGNQSPRQSVRRLEMITDGTRSAWELAERDRLMSIGRELAGIYQIRHVNLAVPDQWNAVVSDVAPAGSIIRVGFNSDLAAHVKSYGRSASAVLQWSMDNEPVTGNTMIEATPDTAPVIQSQARFRDGGAHVVSATFVAGDRLRVDDQRYRVVEVASAMKVLIVEGERGVGAMSSSGAFLELALAPPADAGRSASIGRRSDSYILPERVSDIELGNKVLSDYRAIVLAGVGQIGAGQADLLKRFVEDGGTLLVFMGEPVSSDSYNQVLLPRGLLPGPLTKRMSVAAEQRGFLFDFRPLGALHPVLKVFSGEQKTGLDTAQVFTYWQLELPADAKAERVLDYATTAATADPAITLHPLGGGRVVFISTTANAEWTSLPAKPAYVALVHELLSGSIVGGDEWMNRIVGQTLDLPPNLTFKAVPTLTGPSAQEVQLSQQPLADGRSGYRSSVLAKPGLYSLSTGAATIPIAVNCPADEADIRPAGDAAIRTALGGIEIDLISSDIPAVAEARVGGNDFGWIVMLAVLALVTAESMMAMRFGHHRKGGALR